MLARGGEEGGQDGGDLGAGPGAVAAGDLAMDDRWTEILLRDVFGRRDVWAVEEDEQFVLHPSEFVLGQTLEWVELPVDLVARLEGKSSLGRLGLLIHSTAGYVDPGWKGNLTLELSNVANLPIALYHGMKIGQISFFKMSSPVDRPYGSKDLGSKYQG